MPTPDGFRVTQRVPGGDPVDLTMDEISATWTSSIPGGFGSATITIPRALTQKERGLLGNLTIEYEGRVLFDGRVEDSILKWGKASVSTDLQAFGYQRLLTDCSTRSMWSLRTSLNPTTVSTVKGSAAGGPITLRQDVTRVAFGRYNPADPTKFGIRLSNIGGINNLDGNQVAITLPAAVSNAQLQFDLVIFDSLGGVWRLCVHSTADGVTYTRHIEQISVGSTATLQMSTALVAGAREIRFAGVAAGAGLGGNVAGNDPYIEISNIRVLGTGIREDTAGGFYGGTILRDAIAQCPGIYPGAIEDGSDFVIAEINRINRTTVLDVINQITPLYAREWGVWEAGRFDWITPDLKNPGWVVPLAKITDGTIEQSVDQLAKRVYVPFQDAADQLPKEASSDSTSARNPYVRLGQQKDIVVPSPGPMTTITAPLLAAKISNDSGRWPDIKGQVTILAGTMINAASGSRAVPAFAIRAGDNVTIPDLPVEDIYASGQDGQSVFHVTSVQSGTDGTVVLTLEGLTRRADVLMARLAAFN